MKEQPNKKIYGSLKEYDDVQAARRGSETISEAAKEAIKKLYPWTVLKIATVYAPIPKKAAWARDNRPA